MLRKALIQFDEGSKNSGIVVSVMEMSESGFTGLRAGKNQIIWDCSRFAVSPNDVWRNGVFYTQTDPSTPVEYLPSTEEKLASVEADFTEKDLDNKMAIAEVYEMLLGEGGVV